MPNQDHDVLVYSSNKELYRLPVEKAGANTGSYTQPPQKLSMIDAGYRKVDSIARYEESARGAGFAVLPNKPDPQSSQMSCYVINPQNFRTTTPWTATEWSSADDKRDDGIAIDLTEWQADAFEVLVAAPLGQVYFLRKEAGKPAEVTPVKTMEREGELWTQLRNGVVVGTVRYVGHPDGPTIVPLFNVTALKPEHQHQHTSGATNP
jgi:hypothetical protein